MPNPYHEPAGSSKGGQFTSAQLDTIEDAARTAAGLNNDTIKYTDVTGKVVTGWRDNLRPFIRGKVKDGIIMVGIRGPNKDVVLSGDALSVHSQLLYEFYPDENIDNWVRLYYENDTISADVNAAGVVLTGDSVRDETKALDKALDNISDAQVQIENLKLNKIWDTNYTVDK